MFMYNISVSVRVVKKAKIVEFPYFTHAYVLRIGAQIKKRKISFVFYKNNDNNVLYQIIVCWMQKHTLNMLQ